MSAAQLRWLRRTLGALQSVSSGLAARLAFRLFLTTSRRRLDPADAAVLQQAKAAGVGEVVERELNHPRPLAEIVAGVPDPAQRATLYVLAFTVLRADEQVTGAERIYLAQLAYLLELDPATVQRLEKDAGERIDALGDQGQLGG